MSAHLSQDSLLDFAYGELSPQDAAGAGAHIQDCEECTRALIQIRGVRRVMAELPIEPPPSSGQESLMAYAAQAARRRAAGTRGGRWTGLLSALGGVSALVVIGVIAIQVRPRVDSTVFDPNQAPPRGAASSIEEMVQTKPSASTATRAMARHEADEKKQEAPEGLLEASSKLTGGKTGEAGNVGRAGSDGDGSLARFDDFEAGGRGAPIAPAKEHAEKVANGAFASTPGRRAGEGLGTAGYSSGSGGGSMGLAARELTKSKKSAYVARGDSVEDERDVHKAEVARSAPLAKPPAFTEQAPAEAAPPPPAPATTAVAQKLSSPGAEESRSARVSENKTDSSTRANDFKDVHGQPAAGPPPPLPQAVASAVPASPEKNPERKNLEQAEDKNDRAKGPSPKNEKKGTTTERQVASAEEDQIQSLRRKLIVAKGASRGPLLNALCDAELEAERYDEAEATCAQLLREFPGSHYASSARQRVQGAQFRQQQKLRMMDAIQKQTAPTSAH